LFGKVQPETRGKKIMIINKIINFFITTPFKVIIA